MLAVCGGAGRFLGAAAEHGAPDAGAERGDHAHAGRLLAISRDLRTRALSSGIRTLLAVHLVRFFGFYFVWLSRQGLIASDFAVIAGWGPIIVATGALVILVVFSAGDERSRMAILAWNVVGVLDILLMTAVMTRLSQPDPLATGRLHRVAAQPRSHVHHPVGHCQPSIDLRLVGQQEVRRSGGSEQELRRSGEADRRTGDKELLGLISHHEFPLPVIQRHCGVDHHRAVAQQPAAPSSAEDVRARYTKYEFMVPMRDGVKLFTSIYAPKDTAQKYPFLITRTPYSVGPYGVDQYRSSVGPSEHFQKEGFIFVYQDARGRYMSEGEFQQVRPFVPDKKSNKDIDESTDTYDTIEWLLKNVANHNGRAGMVGVSQPGFHVAASLINSHPALKAASPQAPTADYYMGDDVYHNGAFMLGANFGFYSGFVPRGETPEPPRPALRFDPRTPDMYEFLLRIPPLARVNAELFGGKATYWQEIVDHPNYDEFWKKRSVWRFMDGVKCAVLNVGGWFDAEDPVGPLLTYRGVEQKNPATVNHAGHGAVVAWRMGTRPRQPARQCQLRVQHRGVFPRADPVPVLHEASQGQRRGACPKRGCF